MTEEKVQSQIPEAAAAEKPEASLPGEAAQKPAAPPLKAIIGRKAGMTRVYDERGHFRAVTVVETAGCSVVQVKTTENDGYTALQLGVGATKGKNIDKPEAGHFAKVNMTPVAVLREVSVPKVDGFAPGQVVPVTNFVIGDVVDVSGDNKGKGFAGAVKRHRFSGGPKTHGQSDRWRAPGSSGRERVWPGKRGPGHMGHEWSTVQRLQVVGVDAEQNLLLIHGSIPGPTGSYVTVKGTTRPRKGKKGAPAAAPKKAPKGAAKDAKAAPPAKK